MKYQFFIISKETNQTTCVMECVAKQLDTKLKPLKVCILESLYNSGKFFAVLSE